VRRRSSLVECSRSSTVVATGSPKTVLASSNDTPCFVRFVAAFSGSHSNRTTGTVARLRPAHRTRVPERVHPRCRGHHRGAQGPGRRSRVLAARDCTVPRRSHRRRRVHLHVVLAGGSVRPRGVPLRARARALYESHPRRHGEERQDRLPQDRRAVARRPAPPGLRLPGCSAVVRTGALLPR